MHWSMFIMVAGVAAMTGCAPPPAWERMENPDLKGKTGMAAVDSFLATNGWNMNKSPFALFRSGGGRQELLQGLPWSSLTNSTYVALTSKGILYVGLTSSGNSVSGVAYNPNTNRFPKIVAGFKPLADHWYVWTLLGEDPATRPKLTQRYEGQN
jgi:hypothetical protein